MWNNFDETHDIFQFVKKIMKARKAQHIYDFYFYEKWVDDQLYAFARGQFFVALTNVLDGQVHRDVPNTGFNEGQVVCNIFYPTDCVVIKGGVLSVYLNNGEAKIFVPKGSAFFQSQGELQFLSE
jgi:alpha-amylase